MSPMPKRPGATAPKGNIKKGICTNTDNYYNEDTGETGKCPKCESGEVQFVEVKRLSDFKCQTCGGKLTPVKDPWYKNKMAWIVAAILIAIVIGGVCWAIFGRNPDKVTEPTSITLNNTNISLKVGETETLSYQVMPENAKAEVEWYSSDPEIVTVSNGIVTAVAPGTAQAGVAVIGNESMRAICEITITAPEPIDTIQQKPEVIEEQKVEEPKKVSPTPKPKDPSYVENYSVPGGRYTGQMKNGKPHGQGTLVYTQATVINPYDMKKRMAQPGEKIQGQFVNGVPTIVQHFDSNGAFIERMNMATTN